MKILQRTAFAIALVAAAPLAVVALLLGLGASRGVVLAAVGLVHRGALGFSLYG